MLRVHLRFEKIEKVSKDNGKNLIEISRLVDGSNSVLKLQEVTDAPVDDQCRNYVERSVQILKKINRIMCQTQSFSLDQPRSWSTKTPRARRKPSVLVGSRP